MPVDADFDSSSLNARDSFGQDFLQGFEAPFKFLGSILKREDAAQLLARDSFGQDFLQGFEAPFKFLGSILKREDAELLARSTLGDFAKGFEQGFTGTLKDLAPFALLAKATTVKKNVSTHQ